MIEIYGTLGPMCGSTETLVAMFRAGMTGVRLNLSHTDLRAAARQIEALHTAAERSGVSAKLLVDMQGPELRVGKMKTPAELAEGALIELESLCLPELVRPYLTEGQELLLDDGKLLLRVERGRARVLRGGLLQSRKSLALPGAELSPPTMTESDRENIAAAAEYGVTGVMQPFVRCREDLDTVRAALNAAGGERIRLFAKIENLRGAENLQSLMGGADEIVIARGDLGNAVPLWELPALQKRIAAACRAAGKPFMVVTQMLASMENSPVPTRAEVSDIFNAVLDGAASVMVTGETAQGKYPVETIRYLTATVRSACEYMAENS